MNSTKKEFIMDYHKTCLHIMNDEFEEAADIIGDYVLIFSVNPKKHDIPVKQRIKPMLKSLPDGGFPSFEIFKHFVNRLTEFLDADKFSDPTIVMN